MNRKETEKFMWDKGLGYCASKGYEVHQVLTIAGDATNLQSVVIARVSGATEKAKDTFHWGFYPREDAMDVARRIKRLRKVGVTNVTVIHASERV